MGAAKAASLIEGGDKGRRDEGAHARAVVNRCTTGLVVAVATTAASATVRCSVNCAHNASSGRSVAANSAGSVSSCT